MVSRVFVIGMGLGNPATLTAEALDALAQSELVIGSARLIDSLEGLAATDEGERFHGRDRQMLALVRAEDIAHELHSSKAQVASVVMSGDVGFFSGATRLYGLIDDLDVHVIPGVSSLAYMCARLREPWQDVHVVSVHGREHDAVGAIQSHEKTFVLLGGSASASDVCARLARRGLGSVRVAVGERLSYADERVTQGAAHELADATFDQLSVLFAWNDHPVRPSTAPHLADEAFVRGEVPMTKEEVRELALCKLRVRPHDVVWDVGAGTGSVSVEAARAAYAGQVFAVEKNERALELLQKNKDAFELPHLRIVAGEAPDVLGDLPVPDRVFVGGSSGRLEHILDAVRSANPAARVCISAITLETLSAALAWVRKTDALNVDIVQLGVSKSQKIGAYHLMKAANPVYLVTFG